MTCHCRAPPGCSRETRLAQGIGEQDWHRWGRGRCCWCTQTRCCPEARAIGAPGRGHPSLVTVSGPVLGILCACVLLQVELTPPVHMLKS